MLTNQLISEKKAKQKKKLSQLSCNVTAGLNWDEAESKIPLMKKQNRKIFIIRRSSSAHGEETCCLCARTDKSININIKVKEEKSTVLQVILLLF